VIQLFDELRSLHQLPAEYKVWLQSAAMMQSVGKFMNYQGHHRHTQYIIANSELYGFTPEQRLIVSALARYLGKSRPTPADRVLRLIPVEHHTYVRRAAMLLRMASALHQDQSNAVPQFRTRVTAKRVTITLIPARKRVDLEVWALRKEADYFREIFARDLFVVLD
jgi:exopolyphosphatase/guanosine-5'-triphosphate,3'-diphosphate pyrophosphatase